MKLPDSLYDFSILIGRVSTEDHDRILEALSVLRRQQGNCSFEIIVVDRNDDEITQEIRESYPEVNLIICDRDSTLPSMRTDALLEARGERIIVTEDHCVPSDDWLLQFKQLLDGAPENAGAAGGCVENGVSDTPLDWATFLCEYSGSISPAPEGVADDVPGMNVCYHRRAFGNTNEDLLRRGFWETTLHPLIRNRGLKFFSSDSIRLNHCKKFSLGLFCRQRFVYSRYYAGIRFGEGDGLKRFGAAILAFALPPLLMWRMHSNVARKGRLKKEFWQASPYLVIFTIIWAAGELVGYLFGPGDALAEIE